MKNFTFGWVAGHLTNNPIAFSTQKGHGTAADAQAFYEETKDDALGRRLEWFEIEDTDDTDTASAYPCAFQTWHNGGLKKSATHYSNEFYEDGKSHFEVFVERHEKSNTFAMLHICESEAEYKAKISELFGDDNDDAELMAFVNEGGVKDLSLTRNYPKVLFLYSFQGTELSAIADSDTHAKEWCQDDDFCFLSIKSSIPDEATHTWIAAGNDGEPSDEFKAGFKKRKGDSGNRSSGRIGHRRP